MTVESASYISQLNATYPTGADAKNEGDDHVRMLKNVLKTQFPNFGAAALSASNTQLDKVVTTIRINASAPSESITIDANGRIGLGVAPLSSDEPLALRNSNGILRFGASASINYIWSRASSDGGFRELQLRATDFRWVTGAGVEAVRIDSSANSIQLLNSSAPALSSDMTMVASLASDTQLRLSVRGSDGVTRVANLTLA